MIIVFGNPRSGTTSMYHALCEMGYNSVFSCPISKPDEHMSIRELMYYATTDKTVHAVISWRLTDYYTELFNIYGAEGATYIYCYRSNKSKWAASMGQFGYSKEKIEEMWERTMEFKTEIAPVNYLNTHMFDISNNGYPELVKILQHDDFDPTRPFPHTNKSENLFQI